MDSMESPPTTPNKGRRRLGRLLGVAAAALLAVAGVTLGSGVAHAATQICNSNTTGTEDGYYYTYWSNGSGSSCLTYNGNAYSTSWSSIGDFTAGIGWNPGNTNTVSFTSSVSDSGGTALVSVYGWMTSPLVEYYVEQNWSGSTNGSGTDLGTFSMNGATYTLWEHQQVNQPSINGTQTFEQYIAIPSSPITNSSVNMATVESAWESKGLSVGTMNYETIGSEAYGGGSGSTTINGGASTGSGGGTSGGGGSGSGSCTATLSADGQGSNYYVLKVAVSGSNTWTVTMDMVAPEVVYATSGVNATYPSEYVAELTPGSGGNNFTVTISDNGTWTWPSVSCST
jgi:endo-1,4-beta-xylanase